MKVVPPQLMGGGGGGDRDEARLVQFMSYTENLAAGNLLQAGWAECHLTHF